MASLEYGMDEAQTVRKNRVRTLWEELEQAQKTVEVYLRRHHKTLLDHKDTIRDVLMTALNGGL